MKISHLIEKKTKYSIKVWKGKQRSVSIAVAVSFVREHL